MKAWNAMAYFDYQLQRKQEIEETLLELMLDTAYEQISVKSLTDQLQIARKTYYHYFSNKQACLESLMDRLILESNLQLIMLPENAAFYDVYACYMSFWIDHKVFLDAVIRNNLASLFVKRMMLYLSHEDKNIQIQLNTAELSCDEDVLFYYICGQVHLLLKWCSEGFTLTLDEMVRKILRLVHEPLLSRK